MICRNLPHGGSSWKPRIKISVQQENTIASKILPAGPSSLTSRRMEFVTSPVSAGNALVVWQVGKSSHACDHVILRIPVSQKFFSVSVSADMSKCCQCKIASYCDFLRFSTCKAAHEVCKAECQQEASIHISAGTGKCHPICSGLWGVGSYLTRSVGYRLCNIAQPDLRGFHTRFIAVVFVVCNACGAGRSIP